MRIGLTINDVLSQFYPAMCRKVGRKCLRLNIWDIKGDVNFISTNMRLVENNKNFWLNLNPLSRADDINFEIDYYFSTAPGLMEQFVRDWTYIYEFPRHKIITSDNKLLDMRMLNLDVLIDTNIHVLEEVKKDGRIPIQFVPPYMSEVREDLNPIRHLSQVPEILRKLNYR